MIRIERNDEFWDDLETEHLNFYKSTRDIEKALIDLIDEYKKYKIRLFINVQLSRQIEFLEYLLNNIDSVLTGKPEKLREIISKSISLNIKFVRKKVLKNEFIKTKFHSRLLLIFNYDEDFSKSPDSKTLGSARKWTSYHLTDRLNITVCPYCNRIFTNTFYTKENGKTRPHLDHYYPKSIFPFLAISLYNLIPSCYSCNSGFKGDKDFFRNRHLNPYENAMGNNIVFTLVPQKNKIKNGGNERNGYDLEFTKGNLEAFDLKVNTKLETNPDLLKAWAGSNATFHLVEMYHTHKDILNEMIQKSKIYKEEYLDWLDKKYVGSIFKSRAEIEQMITGNYNIEKEFEKRPLAKLTYDISKELKLLK